MRKILLSVILLSALSVGVAAEVPKEFREHELSRFEEEYLCRAIEGDFGDESFAVKLAVASVVMNRLASPLFPSDAIRVIDSASFFSDVGDIRISEKTRTAVMYAVSGATPADGALYIARGEELFGRGIIIDGVVFSEAVGDFVEP